MRDLLRELDAALDPNRITVVGRRIRRRTGNVLDLIQRPWSNPCPTGPRLNVGLGGGFAAFLQKSGVSGGASVNLGIPVRSLLNLKLTGAQFYVSGNVTGLSGKGLFGGYGPSLNLGITNSPASTGDTSIDVMQAGGAFGLGGEVTANPATGDVGGSFYPAYGYGAYAGRGLQLGLTGAFPQMGCSE